MILDLLLPNENLTSSFERPNYHTHEAVISWPFTWLHCDWLGLFRVAPSLVVDVIHPCIHPSRERAGQAGRRTDGRRGSLLGPRRAPLIDAATAAAVRDRLEVVDAADVAVGVDGVTPALRSSKDGNISFCGLR